VKTTQREINDILWRACDTFRGFVDSSDYKNYILVMLFLKYISDVWKERKEELTQRYGGNQEMIERQLGRERFRLPERTTFDYLYRKRNDGAIGEVIDVALEDIEEANSPKLTGVFRKISFNSENLGDTKERNRRLKNLIEDFADPKLDLRPSRVDEDIIGNGYMFLIEKFASGAGKKGGEFYTPREVSILLAKLLRPEPGDRICDPTCGSGSLLIRVAEEVPEATPDQHNYSIYGQEANGSTWALCRMNMFLHEEDSAVIRWGDTLNNPLLLEQDRLMKFNVVVANPPFSLDKWGAEDAAKDNYKRFWRGVPPKSKADYAFITHMVETALPGQGRVGVIVAHGVLFRGGAEGKIRRSSLEENLLDAVIGLPENLFFGTGIPAAILIFDRSREPGGANEERRHVLFIDASREFQPGKNQNLLRPEDIETIARVFHEREEIARYSRRVPLDEIAENDFNLNIPRYVDTFEPPEEVDIGALQREIDGLEEELREVRAKLAGHLRELGLIDTAAAGTAGWEA
jgi:type I restriction enzyme M protein